VRLAETPESRNRRLSRNPLVSPQKTLRFFLRPGATGSRMKFSNPITSSKPKSRKQQTDRQQ
jgi:hypothetical protein